jgi:hypothetical protein
MCHPERRSLGLRRQRVVRGVSGTKDLLLLLLHIGPKLGAPGLAFETWVLIG